MCERKVQSGEPVRNQEQLPGESGESLSGESTAFCKMYLFTSSQTQLECMQSASSRHLYQGS